MTWKPGSHHSPSIRQPPASMGERCHVPIAGQGDNHRKQGLDRRALRSPLSPLRELRWYCSASVSADRPLLTRRSLDVVNPQCSSPTAGCNRRPAPTTVLLQVAAQQPPRRGRPGALPNPGNGVRTPYGSRTCERSGLRELERWRQAAARCARELRQAIARLAQKNAATSASDDLPPHAVSEDGCAGE